MAKLGSDGLVIPQDVNSVISNTLGGVSISPAAGLGSRASTPDGRVYRYAQVGAASLVAGNLLQGQAPVTNHQGINPYIASGTTAAGTGTFQVQVTLGATQATAGFYTNGYLIVDSGSGDLGYTYSITGNTFATTSGTPFIYLGEPLVKALLTSDTVCLIPNPYSAVVQNPTSATGTPVGVALTAASTSYYCWIQTRGVCGVLGDSLTASAGQPIAPSTTTAGAITVGSTTFLIGNAIVASVSAKTRPAFLALE